MKERKTILLGRKSVIAIQITDHCDACNGHISSVLRLCTRATPKVYPRRLDAVSCKLWAASLRTTVAWNLTLWKNCCHVTTVAGCRKCDRRRCSGIIFFMRSHVDFAKRSLWWGKKTLTFVIDCRIRWCSQCDWHSERNCPSLERGTTPLDSNEWSPLQAPALGTCWSENLRILWRI